MRATFNEGVTQYDCNKLLMVNCIAVYNFSHLIQLVVVLLDGIYIQDNSSELKLNLQKWMVNSNKIIGKRINVT
jgi:hypothetical protein